MSSVSSGLSLASIEQLLGTSSTSSTDATSSGSDLQTLLTAVENAQSTSVANDSSSSTSGNLGLSSEVLSLLQGNSSGGTSSLVSLFSNNGSSDDSSDPFTGVLGLQTSSSDLTAAIEAGQAKIAAANTQTDPLQAVLTAYNTAANTASTNQLQDIANQVSAIEANDGISITT